MRNRNLGNLLIYLFCVVAVCAAIIYSTYHAFPSSLVIISIMMVITLGVSGVCTWFSGDAMPHVKRYCTYLNLVLGIVGCLNLFGHLAMSRELSSAELGVAEQREAEDREDKRAKEATQREIAKAQADAQLLKAQTDFSKAERNRLVHLPVSERRAVPIPQVKTPEASAASAPTSPAETPAESGQPSQPKQVRTPAQVRDAWSWWFVIFSFVEASVAVIGGLGAKVTWAWDRNQNGIDDALEAQQTRTQRQSPAMSPANVTAQTTTAGQGPKA